MVTRTIIDQPPAQRGSNVSIWLNGSVYYADFVVRGVRYRNSLATADKEEAQAEHDRLKAAAWLTIKEPENHTFTDAVALWVATGKKDDSDVYRIRAFKVGKVKITSLPLSAITSDLLSRLLSQYAPASRNRCINLITAILNCAVRAGWIASTPNMERVKVKKGRTRWLTFEEWDRLNLELRGNLKQMARFAVATGLRENNVIGMKWSDIDLRRRIAWVHPDETKGGEAISVPLADDAIEILREQIGQHQTHVFTHDGHPVTKASTLSWKDALVRADIDVFEREDGRKSSTFRWHDLRHTWASWHIMNGTPIEVLQKLGGWKTLQMVLRYAHLGDGHLTSYANNSRAPIPHGSNVVSLVKK